jgi:protein TonB
MAVQIINDMPDVAIHRGDAVPLFRDWKPRAQLETNNRRTNKSRPLFIAVTVGLHALAVLAFLSVRYATRPVEAPAPIEASIIDTPVAEAEAPPMQPPPMVEIQYSLPTPEVSIDTSSITLPTVENEAAITQPATHFVMPPLVESVQYLRPPAPVYPRESSRRREHGTVVLRVLVDTQGKPARIQIERSSGYERLDIAARQAVEKARFQPHEVNGVAQAAQVLIPIEFTRHAS